MERPLGGLRKRRGVRVGAGLALGLRLPEDVCDPLVRRGQACGLRERTELPHRLKHTRQQVYVHGTHRKHGFDLVGGVASLEQVSARALEDESFEVGMCVADFRIKTLKRRIDEFVDWHGDRLLNQDADDAKRCAAQTEWILVSRRLLAYA